MRLTVSLVVLNFAIFFMQVAIPWLTEVIELTPTLAIGGMYWQFFTYMFAHATISHVGFNMLALFIFGGVMENVLGWKKYLTLYIISGLGSGLFHIMLTGISDIPMLGASGAVFAVLTAYAFRFPKNWIIIFPGIPVPAALMVVGFAFFEFFSGLFGLEPGIANFGHLGGIIFGLMIMYYWRYMEKKNPREQDFEFVWETGEI